MDIYKILFDNQYLIGANEHSSISIKGAQKLASIFENKYDFIKIKFINEKDFLNEFTTFFNTCEEYIINNHSSIHKKIKYKNYDSSNVYILFNSKNLINIVFYLIL